MRVLLALSRRIDVLNERIGRCAAWAIFLAICISAGNAILRKMLDLSSNAWLELQWYLFGIVFMFCAPWALRLNEHIRIDVLAGRLSQRMRSWIDVFGHAFILLTLSILMIFQFWPMFYESFQSWEMSGNVGGLLLWPPKLMILIGFALLTLQGFSELTKRNAFVRDGEGGGCSDALATVNLAASPARS